MKTNIWNNCPAWTELLRTCWYSYLRKCSREIAESMVENLKERALVLSLLFVYSLYRVSIRIARLLQPVVSVTFHTVDLPMSIITNTRQKRSMTLCMISTGFLQTWRTRVIWTKLKSSVHSLSTWWQLLGQSSIHWRNSHFDLNSVSVLTCNTSPKFRLTRMNRFSFWSSRWWNCWQSQLSVLSIWWHN